MSGHLVSRRTVLAAGFAAALAGCSGTRTQASPRGGVTLTYTWWGNDDRAARTQRAVRLFERANPGIAVRTSNSEFGAYMQKLATQAAGGGIPDVAQLDYRQITQYSAGGALLPLDEFIKDGTIRTSEMDPGLLRTGTYEGRQYALPQGRGITGYAYDATLYAKAGVPMPKPGWTWEDFEEANKAIAALGLRAPDGRRVTGANDGGGNEDIFEVWLRSRGGQLYAEQKRIAFTEDDLAEFWTFCDRMRREGAIASAEDTAQSGSVETSPMGRRLSAADFTWDAPFPGYTTLLGDSIHFAPVPTTAGRSGSYFKPSMLLGIGAHTEHPEEAARLIDFLLNDREAGSVLEFTRSTPPNRVIAADVAKNLKGPELEIYRYAQTMEKYGMDPPPPAPPRGDVALQTAFNRNYQRVMFEMATPRQAAREFIDEANRELRS